MECLVVTMISSFGNLDCVMKYNGVYGFVYHF